MNSSASTTDALTLLALAIPAADDRHSEVFNAAAPFINAPAVAAALTGSLVAAAEFARAWRTASADERTACLACLAKLTTDEGARALRHARAFDQEMT